MVPAVYAVALSDGMECPHCQTRLEVTTGSRILATWVGLFMGHVVWHFTNGSTGILGWALPVLYAILAVGITSALMLMAIAGLRLAPAAPVPAAVSADSHGHAAGHH